MLTAKRLDQYIYWCLCGFAAITCINHVIGNQLLGVCVLLGLIRAYKERPRLMIPASYQRALLIFFGVMFISIFFSPDMVKSAKEFWRYSNRMVPFILVVFFVKEKKQLLCILGIFFVSLLIGSIDAIYTGVCLIFQGKTYLRVGGFNVQAIVFSAYLLMVLPILTILFFESKRRKGFIFFSILIFLTALLMNGTRVVWTIVAVFLPVITFLYVRDIKKIVLIILLCIGTIGMLVYTVPFVQARVMSFVDDSNVSNRGHYLIARDSMKMIEAHPWFGIGLGRFGEAFNEQYRSEEHIDLERGLTPHAHNNILTVWAETGILGCIAFCFMFASFLYCSAKRWFKERNPSDLIFFLLTLGLMMQGITDFSFGLNQAVKIYFCLLAIYLNYQIYEQRKSV